MAQDQSQLPESGRTQIAVVRIGESYIGIDAGFVAHATIAPETGSAIPRRAGALAGVIEYAKKHVPVIDLRRWVNLGQHDKNIGSQRVLILQTPTRSAGLLVDEILGLITVDRSEITRLIHDDNADEVFHSVVTTDDTAHIVNLLDCDNLMGLAAAWVKTDSTTVIVPESNDNISDVHSTAAAVSYALFEVGSSIIAVEAITVAEVLPMPALHSFESPEVYGLCDWRERKVVILSPKSILGESASTCLPLVAIFTFKGLSLGLPVQRATQLIKGIDLSKATCLSDFVHAYFDTDGHKLHVVDTENLFKSFPEAAISKLAINTHTNEPKSKTNSLNKTGFIAYEADGHAALPLSAIEEILPGSMLKTDDLASAVMQWRGHSLRILDLRSKGSSSSDVTHTQGHLIITRRAHDIVACLVHRVSTLIAPGSGEIFKVRLSGTTSTEVITTGNNGGKVSYAVADIESLG